MPFADSPPPLPSFSRAPTEPALGEPRRAPQEPSERPWDPEEDPSAGVVVAIVEQVARAVRAALRHESLPDRAVLIDAGRGGLEHVAFVEHSPGLRWSILSRASVVAIGLEYSRAVAEQIAEALPSCGAWCLVLGPEGCAAVALSDPWAAVDERG